ncbi:hypothetical protein SHIRM173S_01759 [Streptomyces hirsutus]
MLVEQVLVGLDLGAFGRVGEGVGGAAGGAAPALDLLLEDTAEQPAVQRGPGMTPRPYSWAAGMTSISARRSARL